MSKAKFSEYEITDNEDGTLTVEHPTSGEVWTFDKDGSLASPSVTTDQETLTGNYIYAYGANGNYVEPFDPADYADGGAAVQAAIDALPAYQTGLDNPGRGEVYTPRGVYYPTSPIQLTGRMGFKGASTKATMFYVPNGADTNVFEWIPPSTNSPHFTELSQFTIAGNEANNTSGKGIVLDDTNGGRPSELILKDVYIRDMSDHGIVLSGSWSCRIERCTPEANGKGNGRDNIFINTTNNENLHVSNCFLAYAGRYGAYVAAQEATFRNNWFYQNDARGATVGGDRNHFVGNRFYANSQGSAGTYAGVYIDGKHNVFAGNYYDGNKSGTTYEKHAIRFGTNAVENVVKPAYINWAGYTSQPVLDEGKRNVVGNRVTSPEQYTMSSTGEFIAPVHLPVSNIPVHVTPNASGRTIQGVDNIDNENQQVALVNVGTNSVTLGHNVAVASPLINQSAANDTLGVGQMARYEYETIGGEWRQIMPPV